jgi:hypothetical protein
MQVKITQKIGALFKLIVRKQSDNSIARESEFFHNIVLDTGLARMSAGTWIDRCCVGSGNSVPVATQTALDNFRASTTNQNTTSTSVNTSTTPYYFSAKVTWRFPVGAATGNISEVGMGWSDANLWNRALVKDIGGNPTTITVLSDEYLDVVSEIRLYPELSTSGTFNLLDKSGAIINSISFAASPYIGSAAISFSKVSALGLQIYSGTKNDAVNSIPNYPDLGAAGSLSVTYPTTTSMQVIATCAIGVATGTHQSLYFRPSGIVMNGQGGYKFQLSPTITKNASQSMTYTILLSWGRYTP